MKIFWYTSLGSPVGLTFMADSWEEGGVDCKEDGTPSTDSGGNTIQNYGIREIEENDFQHAINIYVGDDYHVCNQSSYKNFYQWLVEDAGIVPEIAEKILKKTIQQEVNIFAEKIITEFEQE